MSNCEASFVASDSQNSVPGAFMHDNEICLQGKAHYKHLSMLDHNFISNFKVLFSAEVWLTAFNKWSPSMEK